MGIGLEHYSSFLLSVISFLLKFGEPEVGFAERDPGREIASEEARLFKIEIKFRPFSCVVPFLSFSIQQWKNNKACCRKLGSELSVFQHREDILEMNPVYQGFWAAFESYSS